MGDTRAWDSVCRVEQLNRLERLEFSGPDAGSIRLLSAALRQEPDKIVWGSAAIDLSNKTLATECLTNSTDMPNASEFSRRCRKIR